MREQAKYNLVKVLLRTDTTFMVRALDILCKIHNENLDKTEYTSYGFLKVIGLLDEDHILLEYCKNVNDWGLMSQAIGDLKKRMPKYALQLVPYLLEDACVITIK